MNPPTATSRITEVTDVAAVETVSSADREAHSSRDLVKYVNPKWEEVHAVERRKLPQVLTDSHSDERPPRRRARTTYDDEMEVSEDGEGEPAERVTPEARVASGPREEGDTVRVRAGRNQRQEEDTGRFRVVRTPREEGESSRRDKGKQQATVETEEEVVVTAAGPAVRKQVKKVRTPKAPRHIRMMVGHEGFDVLAEFRDMPVANLKWGALLDMAPSLRRVVGTGLLLEQQPRKAKQIRKDKPVDALAVNARFPRTGDEEPCVNFYTVATIKSGGREYDIERTLIDAGSVVNLASHAVLEQMGAPLMPSYDLTIRTATSTLTTIKYYSDLDVSVAGVTTWVRVYAIPREISLSYGLLLSRRWLKRVKARGNYELDTYYIQNSRGRYVEIPRDTEMRANAVEVPTVRLTNLGYGESSVDDETREELELAVTTSESEDDVLREVIGQATREMRRQTASDDTEASGYDSGDEWAGNGGDF